LAALKVLPVHHLKIDQSFVRHMHEDANDATIVRSVIDLGRTLGLRTIAEGVEHQEAWDQLRDLGCDAAQGHLLARAMPPEELLGWMQAVPQVPAPTLAG
jgi:EAL domain-containing protein (putative c-di-GMP-specific phosphodiesterase class I)